jgi:hypothetical protein
MFTGNSLNMGCNYFMKKNTVCMDVVLDRKKVTENQLSCFTPEKVTHPSAPLSCYAGPYCLMQITVVISVLFRMGASTTNTSPGDVTVAISYMVM